MCHIPLPCARCTINACAIYGSDAVSDNTLLELPVLLRVVKMNWRIFPIAVTFVDWRVWLANSLSSCIRTSSDRQHVDCKWQNITHSAERMSRMGLYSRSIQRLLRDNIECVYTGSYIIDSSSAALATIRVVEFSIRRASICMCRIESVSRAGDGDAACILLQLSVNGDPCGVSRFN